MVGLGGGFGTAGPDRVLDWMAARSEDWQEVHRFAVGASTVGALTHGSRDREGFRTWERDGCTGMLLGTVRSIDARRDPLPARVLADPAGTVSGLEGSFSLLAAAEGEVIVATDRLGTRPVYYTSGGQPSFAPSPSALAPVVEDPTVDARSVVDLARYGAVQGQRTLLEEVRAVPPGSYARVTDTGCEVERYDWLDFPEGTADALDAEDGYVDAVYAAYRESVRDEVETVADGRQLGTWLSGGLDSRLLAGVLAEFAPSLRTFTYDANPGGGVNPDLGTRVAETLGVRNDTTEFTADEFAERLEEGVALTGGRFSWRDMHNLPFALDRLHEHVDVLVDVPGQGELFGEDLAVENVREAASRSPLAVYQDRFARVSEDEIADVVRDGTSEDGGLGETASSIPHEDPEHVLFELVRQCFYPNHHYRSKFYAFTVPLRFPLSDDRILDHWTSMPPALRQRLESPHLLGRFPDAVSALKLRLVRRVDRGLESIPYERTGVPPEYPLAAHTVRWLAREAVDRLERRTCRSANPGLYTRWYRTNQRLQELVDEHLERAGERDLYDADALDRLRSAHLDGNEDNIDVIAGVTTAEIWLRNHTNEPA